MPFRLPRRRPMGPTAPPEFRRRAAPTPQATRLMKVSLSAGVLFLFVLGIVFVPRALEYQGVEPPSVGFAVAGTDPFAATVSRASRGYGLDAYRGELNLSRGFAHENVSLGPDLTVGAWTFGNASEPGTVTFVDADGNGLLSVGDQFRVTRKPGSGWTYHLAVFYKPREVGAGFPCPCAAGFAEWTA